MTAHLDINKLREIAEKETKFPGYSVDAEGNIWSTIPWRGKPKRKLAPFPNSHGYPSVKVKTDQGVKKALIHVLVCTAFHGNVWTKPVGHRNQNVRPCDRARPQSGGA